MPLGTEVVLGLDDIVLDGAQIPHYTGQPALASTPSYEWEDFVTAKFLLPTCPLWYQVAGLD